MVRGDFVRNEGCGYRSSGRAMSNGLLCWHVGVHGFRAKAKGTGMCNRTGDLKGCMGSVERVVN